MAGVMNGRYTAKVNEPFVVFIIGMRINNVFAVRKQFPAVRAMFPMLRELSGHPESHCRAGASGSCACRTVSVLELDLEGVGEGVSGDPTPGPVGEARST